MGSYSDVGIEKLCGAPAMIHGSTHADEKGKKRGPLTVGSLWAHCTFTLSNL